MKVAGGEDRWTQWPGMPASRDGSPASRLWAGSPKHQLQPLELRGLGPVIFTLLPSVFLDLPFLQSDSSPKLGWDGTWQGGAGCWCPWWSEGGVGDEEETPY